MSVDHLPIRGPPRASGAHHVLQNCNQAIVA